MIASFYKITFWFISIVLTLVLGILGISRMIQNSSQPAVAQSDNGSPVLSEDSISFPPERQTFVSENGRYVFVVSTQNSWQSKQAVGELFDTSSNPRQLLWRRTLPQEYGPRYVRVGNEGEVLLLDEWINVASEYAIMLLNRESELVARYDFDRLQEVLDVPRARIVDMAKEGWWISLPPVLSDSGDQVRVETGGKVLRIDLREGKLYL